MNNFIFADSNFFLDGEDLWLLTGYTDVLMHFCRSDMSLIEYFIIPTQFIQKNVHFRLENTKDGIYVIPHLGNNLFYFHKQTKELKEILLPSLEKQFVDKRKIRLAAFWNGNLFLAGYDVPSVYFLNHDSEEIVNDNTYLDALRITGAKAMGGIFGGCSCQSENKLYIPLTEQPFIFCADFAEKSFHVFRVMQKDEVRICTIDKYGCDEKFLLTTSDDEKIIWSPENGVEEQQKIGLLNKGESYLRAYHIENKNYYIPANERKIYVEQGKNIRDIPYASTLSVKYPEYTTEQYGWVYRSGKEIYFQTRSGELLCLDTVKDEICTMEFHVSSDKVREMKDRILEMREIPSYVMEQSCFHLGDYLKSII